MLRGLLRYGPVGLGAFVMALLSLLLLANIVRVALHMGPMKLTPSLSGVVLPEKAHWTLRTALDGSSQAAFARQIGVRMPLYPAAVRLRNQVEYSLFHTSAIPAVMAGRESMLIETAYAEEYCSRDLAAWRPGAVKWAADIRAMQDFYQGRGKAFLYVLTPSKVAQYPAILPRGYTCPSSEADRAGFIPEWLAMLHAAGVNVADTITPLLQAHAAYPFTLYPPGGTHWNDVGGAIAQQAVFAALDRALPGHGFSPFTFTWRMEDHPTGRDIDLARLMNLFIPVTTGPVPIAALQFQQQQACQPLNIVIVGGSFSHTSGDIMSASPCHPTVTEYEYWRRLKVTWPDAVLTYTSVFDFAARDAAVLAADVLIYEENEQLVVAPYHGKAFWEFLQAQRK